MKIKTIEIESFTSFSKNSLEFSPGLNIFIGANGTGKTHLMKLLYSVLKVNEAYFNDKLNWNQDELSRNLADKLIHVFRPDKLGRLVTRKKGYNRKNTLINIQFHNQTTNNFFNCNFKFSQAKEKNVDIETFEKFEAEKSIFIPVREMLTLFNGFIGLYEERDIGFDETYFDLAKALDLTPLRGPREQEIKVLLNALKSCLQPESILQKDGQFYFKIDGGEMEAPLVAEGLRKLGTLVYLIKNGVISPNSFLFWDEPESNLNPRFIAQVAKFLVTLAANGVQVFIATHDYLLSRTLSIYAENIEKFKTEPGLNGFNTDSIRFFCLNKDGETDGTQITSGNTLGELENNPIMEEFTKHYQWEEEVVLG